MSDARRRRAASARRAREAGVTWRLVALPFFAGIAAFTVYMELGDLSVIVPGWVVGLIVAIAAGLTTLRIALGTLVEHDAGPDALADPDARADRRAGTVRVLVGEVLYRNEIEATHLARLAADVAARWIDLDVRHAYRVAADGSAEPAPDLLGTRRLTVSRDDFVNGALGVAGWDEPWFTVTPR